MASEKIEIEKLKIRESDSVVTQLVANETFEQNVTQLVANSSLNETQFSNSEIEFGPVMVTESSFTEKLEAQLETIQQRFWNYSLAEISAGPDTDEYDYNEHSSFGLTVFLYAAGAGKRKSFESDELVIVGEA
jgi:hypothetical protein